MTYALIAVAFVALGFAGTAVALALRTAGIVEEREKLRAELGAATALIGDQTEAFERLSEELYDTKRAHLREVEPLRAKLAQLRARILDLPQSPAAQELIMEALAEDHGFTLPTLEESTAHLREVEPNK